MKTIFLIISLICLISAHDITQLDHSRLAPPKHRHELETIIHTKLIKNANSYRISLTQLGGDPTGVKDSFQAFNLAIAELIKRKNENHTLANGIFDMGGAVIDLEGGVYMVSNRVYFPDFYGNYQIQDGTLRASDNFPTDKYLLDFGGDLPCPNKQESCIQNIGISHLFLDGNHRALGDLRISNAMGATIGPQIFFTGFAKYGIYLKGGHESMLHQTWFGANYYHTPRPSNEETTAIVINGNDHIITDTIVFEGTGLGLEVRNQATLITGFHSWNGGKYGIIFRSDYIRMFHSYLDYTRLLITGRFGHTIIENTFFLESTIILEPHGDQTISDFFVLNSDYQNWSFETGAAVIYSTEFGKFTSISNVKVENMFHTLKNSTRLTHVRLSLQQEKATNWVFDLSKKLVFNRIGNVQYSIQNNDNKAVTSYIKPFVSGETKVEIVTSEPVTGTIYIEVDENTDN